MLRVGSADSVPPRDLTLPLAAALTAYAETAAVDEDDSVASTLAAQATAMLGQLPEAASQLHAEHLNLLKGRLLLLEHAARLNADDPDILVVVGALGAYFIGLPLAAVNWWQSCLRQNLGGVGISPTVISAFVALTVPIIIAVFWKIVAWGSDAQTRIKALGAIGLAAGAAFVAARVSNTRALSAMMANPTATSSSNTRGSS